MKNIDRSDIILMLFRIIGIVTFCLLMLPFFNRTVTTEGFAPIAQKEFINGSYFITVGTKETFVTLECEEDLYNELIIDEYLAYGISYTRKNETAEKGKLIYVNTDDVIDNRENHRRNMEKEEL